MSDELNSVVPGQPMSEEQRAALAKSNAEETAMAHRLAAEHAARDAAENGNAQPVVQVVAGSVLEKLKSLPAEKPAE